VSFGRWSKIWVVATLCALLAYDLRWFLGVLITVSQVLSNTLQASWWRFWFDYVPTGLFGDGIRLLGVCCALYAAYSVWGPSPKTNANLKKIVAAAVLCEGISFLTLLPLTLIELSRGLVTPILMMGYLLRILIVSPVLLVLSRKVWTYTELNRENVLKWTGAAAVSYLAGIWVVNVFSWIAIAQVEGASFILSSVTALGFFNAVTTLSVSVILAVAGFFTLLKKANKRLSTQLFALALVMVGVYFIVFILYSVISNTVNYVLLVEVWPITFLGLGLSILKTGD
jgi:hypothetical protein